MKVELCDAVPLILRGYGFMEAGEILGCSHTTVRSRWEDFQKLAEEVGLLEAAERCGVREELEKLRNFSREIKKKEGVSLDDCVLGFGVKEKADTLGLDLEAADGHLAEMLHYSQEQGLSGEQVGEMALRLHSVEACTGLGYMTLVEESERLRREKQSDEETLVKLRVEIKEQEEERERCLRKAEVTEDKLDEYLLDKKKLADYNLEVSDSGKTMKVLRDLKEREYDPGKVIRLIDEHSSLSGAVKDKKKILEQQEKRVLEEGEKLEGLVRKRKRLEEEITAIENRREFLLEPLEALESLNLNRVHEDDIIKIRELVEQAGYTLATLLAKLLQIGSLNKIIEAHREEHGELENHVRKLEKTKKSLEEDLEYLNDQRKRVRDETIAAVDTHNDWVKNSIKDFQASINDPEEGLSAKIKEALETPLRDTTEALTAFKEEFKKELAELEKESGGFRGSIEELNETVFGMGETVGQYRHLSNLAKLYTGEESSRVERRLTIATTLDLLMYTLEKDGYEYEKNRLGEVRDSVLRRY